MERIDTVEKTQCTGCTACVEACQSGAILMKEDENGFLFPCIDEKRCIHCKFCSIICSEKNVRVEELTQKEPLRAYAVKHREKEIHRTSQPTCVLIKSQNYTVCRALNMSQAI